MQRQGQLLSTSLVRDQLKPWQAEQDQNNPLMNRAQHGAPPRFASDENIRRSGSRRVISKALKRRPIGTVA